jgi:hypothetical protein
MKNSFCLSGVAAALLGVGLVHGQSPTSPSVNLAIPPAVLPSPAQSNGNGDNGSGPLFGGQSQTPAAPQSPNPGISTWLAYPRSAGCCCPTGKNGPIWGEFYVRSGVSVPFGGFFGSVMNAGWDVEAGVRALLFNPEQDAAWTADLSITNIHYNTTTANQRTLTNLQLQLPNAVGGVSNFTIPSLPVTPSGLNDTTLNLAFGRECYLYGTAECQGEPRFRIGYDVGGRWGSSKLDLREIRHKTGAIEGFFTSVHSDVEIPCSCCIIEAGLRLEYGYLFSDILQSATATNMSTVNCMFTIGTRY